MAIVNFVPEIWSAALLEALRARLVFAQDGLINRDYEGDIARAGDTVHITSFNDPAVRTYTKNQVTNASPGVTWDLLTDAQKTLTVSTADYFAFAVDDIDRRQAIGGFVESVTRGAAYQLASKTDTYVSGLMVAGTTADNQFGDVTFTGTGDAYGLLVDMRTRLTRTNTPEDNRWAVVPPEFYALLLADEKFIRADESGTTEGLRNGFVGRAAGFNIIESNTSPVDATGDAPVYTVIAGHSMATTFAEQIANTEAMRLQNAFSDGIRGLHLYGGLVTRPDLLVTADITLPTG